MVNVKPKTSSQHGAANRISAVSSHTAKKASKNPISVKKPISVKRLQTIKNSGQVSSS